LSPIVDYLQFFCTMSRRRGEFEHRTSIFEGAFRAWSYLGGLDPLELESKSLAELDPLNAKAEQRAKDDPRLAATEYKKQKADNLKLSKKDNDASLATRRIYPYEPLPRSGLAHPFVQAILSPWLGPEAEQNAIQLGLTTLRTWWQHRRKGESGSAVQALGTDKMRGVVEGYTRHFFSLAYCLVTNDGEQPPRTLATKMKDLEKVRQKKHKRKTREEEAGKMAALALNAGITSTSGLGPEDDGDDGEDDEEDDGDDEDAATGAGEENPSSLVPGMMNIGGFAKSAVGGSVAGGEPDAANGKNMSDLERRFALKQSQIKPLNRQQQALEQALQPAIDMKGKCIPGKLDLQQLALQIQAHGTQSMHMGGGGAYSGVVTPDMAGSANLAKKGEGAAIEEFDGKTPIVFISPTTGDIQIAMSVDGITCAHCVKIVETVLKGCNGNKSPIEGLLDAAADHDLCSVIIKIDKSSNAKRIAKESARNLAMVGYTAKVMEMTIDLNNSQRGNGQKIDVGLLNSAFDVVAATDPSEG
jgi:copper chaperone CopZ